MPPMRAAVSVVVFRGDEVLLVRRARPPAQGLWAPVGGRIEPGESAEAAALREVREETGIEARLLGECGRRRVDGRTSDGAAMIWDLRVFAAGWLAGDPIAGDDAAEAVFVALDRLDEQKLVEGGAEAIHTARRLFDGSPDPDGVRKP